MPASQDALANFLRTSLRSGTAADAPEVTPLYDLVHVCVRVLQCVCVRERERESVHLVVSRCVCEGITCIILLNSIASRIILS